jgi:hypothetical protein
LWKHSRFAYFYKLGDTEGSNWLYIPLDTRLPTDRQMKISHLTALVSLLIIVVPTLAQERSRFFDNFDTTGGVQVRRNDFVPVASKTRTAAPKAVKGKKLVQRTVQSRMNVTEGFADREIAKYPAGKQPLGSSTQLKGFTTGDPIIDSYIVDSSSRHGIDPLLIYAQMHQESSFKLRATSNKGASGLMQLMPGTARRMGVTDIYDPQQNIEGGVKYMRLLLDMFGGDINLALAGYNAGEGAVMKFGNQIPPYNETQEYVRRISDRYNSIADGSFARSVRRVNNAQVAKLEQKVSRPLTVYEPDAMAIRLADGRMRLVNQ